jgi:hypothetical protein
MLLENDASQLGWNSKWRILLPFMCLELVVNPPPRIFLFAGLEGGNENWK